MWKITQNKSDKQMIKVVRVLRIRIKSDSEYFIDSREGRISENK